MTRATFVTAGLVAFRLGPWALASLGLWASTGLGLTTTAFAQGAASFRERSVVPIVSGEWTGSRLPDGQPDVEGHWSNTIGNHNNLADPQGGGPDEQERRRPLGPRGERAPSRVSDPATGEVPFQPWARAKAEEFAKHLTDFDSGTRVIRLDASPHLPDAIKLWNGDSRGHWEGNTLVVDVANNNGKSRLARTGEFASEHVHIVERYIFDASKDRFTYEAVYIDPTVFTRPFTITIPNRRITPSTPQDGWNNVTFRANHSGPEPILEVWERACVENNGPHGDVAATP